MWLFAIAFNETFTLLSGSHFLQECPERLELKKIKSRKAHVFYCPISAFCGVDLPNKCSAGPMDSL